ncbi:hypothetical protein [Rodentibacter pneumotropicus]|uniref:hypothetical protein n=1 Tax=Rodentibacter pneumotropicus TaxID=758 RepID=UPI00109C741F|nr:hypothetical protein [Rodentibacter pneumotropicus]NBH74740.1 hypothetical protein [Rodentibacter pneumotropicus]THA02771.1 hypothetical protein D3M73_11590 [Rodentibacter pneumotropicus]THA09148.1 hypothetical protein D3M81_11510 [Rodentibacter pneumotropicus]
MGITSIIELDEKLGGTSFFFVVCFSLTGILDSNNNTDLRDKLLDINTDMCEGRKDFILFDYLSEFLSFCLKNSYITQKEYNFLSQFKFYYKRDGVIRLI